MNDAYQLIEGDALASLRELPDASARCCVTSPPYWRQRDYGFPGQYGWEETPEAYVDRLVAVFSQVHRVLAADGTLWLNIGDCYAGGGRGGGGTFAAAPPQGLTNKDLLGMPWRLAFALQADGWVLRSEIIWYKTNAMPESVGDRPTRAHEQLFLLAKQKKYSYNAEAIRENYAPDTVARAGRGRGGNGKYHDGGPGNQTITKPGPDGTIAWKPDKQRGHSRRHAGFNERWDLMSRAEQAAMGANKRDVWPIATEGYEGEHYAVMPWRLAEPCVLAGSAPDDIVLDPFCGTGTTGVVGVHRGRKYIGIDGNIQHAQERLGLPLFDTADG